MGRNITLLDGAVGTSLWAKAEQRGLKKVPVWRYNVEQPDMVRELAGDFIQAGSRIILTNTFGANRLELKRSSDYTTAQVINTGVRLAKEAVAGTGVKTALAVGPLSVLMEPYGDLEEDEAQDIYEEMIGAGMEEKPDCIMIQTFIDLEMMKVAARVAKQYIVPVYCTMTFEKVGKTIMGNSVQQIIDGLTPIGIDGIGLNCSIGPDQALHIVKEFAEKTDLPIVFKPNAGKPILAGDGTTAAAYTAEMFVSEIAPALEYVDYVGGCCGCGPEYIRQLNELLKK